MRQFTLLAVVLSLVVSARASDRQRTLMDEGWRFTLNDPPDAGNIFDYAEAGDLAKARPIDVNNEAAINAQHKDAAAVNLGADVSFVKSDFNDSTWRPLDLPHDWTVELGFDRNGNNGHGSHAMLGTLGNTIGWYRHSFNLDAADKGHAIWIEFDGVYRNSLVWLNGHCLGRNVSGYSSFWYDIAKFANFGGTNELVVRVDATHTEGWFYEGAGIYRHVWLVKADPVHVAHWGVYATTDVEGPNASIMIRTTLRNDSDTQQKISARSAILDADGKPITQLVSLPVPIDPGAERVVQQQLSIPNVHLWSTDEPYLYKLASSAYIPAANPQDGGTNWDTNNVTNIGVRTLRFDPNQGFFLNGKHLIVQGTCNHQDHAGVGSALPDRLQYFRVEKLKEMGANAYRTSHNDPTPELLDACDKLGMLVMDEHREMGWDAERLDQIRRLVMRDRNHPSVFMWSIGNEEGIQTSPLGASIALAEQDLFHSLDPTRPCTEAMNSGWGQGLSNVIDVQGFNYLRQGGGGGARGSVPTSVDGYTAMDRFHANFPSKPSIGTEEASTLSTRGQYADDATKSFETAYDLDNPRWGCTAEQWWPYYLKRPWVCGAFVWTGFDYRGEPTPYRWPAVSSQFGIMDTCGFPKDIFYYYQANWTTKPMVHLLPHWNWAGKEGTPIDVWCFSNVDTVNLMLNGKDLGSQKVNMLSHENWKVPYAPGTLEARGFKDGKLVASDKVETTGAPAKVSLIPDRTTIDADGRDISLVTVAVTDDQGRNVPTADNLIKFSITGGKLIGVGNGDPASHEPDKAAERHVFAGLCQAIVQSTKDSGPITLTASGEGLATTTVTINAQTATTRPAGQ
jgi:beta-galactosidase